MLVYIFLLGAIYTNRIDKDHIQLIVSNRFNFTLHHVPPEHSRILVDSFDIPAPDPRVYLDDFAIARLNIHDELISATIYDNGTEVIVDDVDIVNNITDADVENVCREMDWSGESPHNHHRQRRSRRLSSFGGRLDGCVYPLQEMNVSFLVDTGFTRKVMAECGSSCDTYVSEVSSFITKMLAETNRRFEEQWGIRLLKNVIIINDADGRTNTTWPNFFSDDPSYNTCEQARDIKADLTGGTRSQAWVKHGSDDYQTEQVIISDGIVGYLGAFTQWVGENLKPENGAWHLLTDCFPCCTSTIGLAFIGQLCKQSVAEVGFVDQDVPFVPNTRYHHVLLSNGNAGRAVRLFEGCRKSLVPDGAHSNWCFGQTSLSSYSNYLGWRIFAHEIGHTIGAYHVSSGLMKSSIGSGTNSIGPESTDVCNVLYENTLDCLRPESPPSPPPALISLIDSNVPPKAKTGRTLVKESESESKSAQTSFANRPLTISLFVVGFMVINGCICVHFMRSKYRNARTP